MGALRWEIPAQDMLISTFLGPSKNIKYKTLLPAFAEHGTAWSVLGDLFMLYVETFVLFFHLP